MTGVLVRRDVTTDMRGGGACEGIGKRQPLTSQGERPPKKPTN